MTDKARYRQAARVHRQLVKGSEGLRRQAEREMRRIYPVRVGQRYANALGARYVVVQVDWGVSLKYGPWRQGPLVVLKFDSPDFDYKTVKYWDELSRELRRVKGE
jgi:hypothetical protein